MKPKVSIVIPIYNVEAYIERCARSLFEQTLDELEFIFINDCTPDNSMQILQTVVAEYPNRKEQVVVINHSINLGAAKAREDGIKAATGEYIIHCDSDDWVDCNMYEIMYEKAKSDLSDIVICDYFNTDGSNHIQIHQNIDVNSDFLFLTLNGSIAVSLWNKLVASHIYKLIENYPTEHMAEDKVYCTQFFFFSKKISYVPQSFYYYYYNNHSVSKDIDKETTLKRYNQACRNTELIIIFLTRHGLDKKYKNEMIFTKSEPRKYLIPLICKQPLKYYSLWFNTYPEINWKYLFIKGHGKSKLVFVLTLTMMISLTLRINNALKHLKSRCNCDF